MSPFASFCSILELFSIQDDSSFEELSWGDARPLNSFGVLDWYLKWLEVNSNEALLSFFLEGCDWRRNFILDLGFDSKPSFFSSSGVGFSNFNEIFSIGFRLIPVNVNLEKRDLKEAKRLAFLWGDLHTDSRRVFL